MKIENEMSSNFVISELGNRIKQYRINLQITQAELAKMTGISLRNIIRIEKGEDTQVKNVIKILSALHLQNNLDLLIPDESDRPLHKINVEKNKIRNRASAIKNKSSKYIWGDER